ncbi:hypothetical protein EZV62_004964 [Acer yangbiense]|uniref:Zinc knuckle CX2CX4HX4C domain-containing protein n=1 Tax=Acer yangbiense TaxID=1000413 RepID=A0A5C7ILT0_9ROSI|nr:hypothetical protein EZV62_004964 [Acer yangbiense]
MALCLAGKILSPNLVNRDAFRALIPMIWKPRGSVDIEVDGEETAMPIQYERLPSFCFSCGLVGHTIHGFPSAGGQLPTVGKDLQFGAWLRATNTFRSTGNREWNSRNFSGGYRRSNQVGVENRKNNEQPADSGSSPSKSATWLANWKVPERIRDGSLVGEICTDRNGMFGREDSNSNLNLDELLCCNSGDCGVQGKKLSNRETIDFVVNKDSSVVELEGVMPSTKIDGLDPKPIFVFRSSGETILEDELTFLEGKVIDRGPSENSLKPNNHVLRDVGETGEINRSKSAEINKGSTVSIPEDRKGSGNSGRKVRQWKKAARNKQVVERVSVKDQNYGKRKEIVTENCFKDGFKKSKRNQFVHSSSNARNEDIVAWAADYVEDFLTACYDASVAEASAILHGLWLAIDNNFLPAVLESETQRGQFGISISFVPRVANKAAHA